MRQNRDVRRIALQALDAAARRGVAYADVRVVESRVRTVSVRNGRAALAVSDESLGVGIRVLAGGCWGFAATDDLSAAGIEAAAALAVEIAHASRAAKNADLLLAEEDRYEAVWTSPCQQDPFATSVEENLAHLVAADAEMRRIRGVTLTEASMIFERRRQVFASTPGSIIEQSCTVTGAGIAASSYRENEIQKRSYPNSFGGQYQLRGYELIKELGLVEHAASVAEEAVALHSADPCPDGVFDLILDGSQLALQIHESIGHPTELDRVLGSEANYAGLSFLCPADLGRLRYGSEIVNVVCDARLEHGPGLGTFAFDDEGVPAQRTDLIRNGILRGFMTSRETAAAAGLGRSNGTMRAESWARIPLIRMTNVSLLAGEQTLEEVFAGHAIYMETNRSWSIDDRRVHFQFGCEIAWEIRDGRRVRMLKNPIYSGRTLEFWNSCTAVAGPEHWVLWGVPNCGKGQPEQVIGTGHGASPARFRGVRVGAAYADQAP
jgi:TldD protein